MLITCTIARTTRVPSLTPGYTISPRCILYNTTSVFSRPIVQPIVATAWTFAANGLLFDACHWEYWYSNLQYIQHLIRRAKYNDFDFHEYYVSTHRLFGSSSALNMLAHYSPRKQYNKNHQNRPAFRILDYYILEISNKKQAHLATLCSGFGRGLSSIRSIT